MAVSPAWAGAHIDLRTEARDGRIPLSTEDAYRYARWLGARYDSRKNLIWLLGGDVRPTRHDAHDAIAKGLADHYVQQHGGTSKLMVSSRAIHAAR